MTKEKQKEQPIVKRVAAPKKKKRVAEPVAPEGVTLGSLRIGTRFKYQIPGDRRIGVFQLINLIPSDFSKTGHAVAIDPATDDVQYELALDTIVELCPTGRIYQEDM